MSCLFGSCVGVIFIRLCWIVLLLLVRFMVVFVFVLRLWWLLVCVLGMVSWFILVFVVKVCMGDWCGFGVFVLRVVLIGRIVVLVCSCRIWRLRLVILCLNVLMVFGFISLLLLLMMLSRVLLMLCVVRILLIICCVRLCCSGV